MSIHGYLINGLCSECGNRRKPGSDPDCPNHGTIEQPVMMAHDEINGGAGIWLENYGPEPVFVRSHTERKAILKARGLREKENWCPAPGTDKDPQGVPNPNLKDPYTLAAGAAILARNGAKGPDPLDGFSERTLQPFDYVGSHHDAIEIQDLVLRGRGRGPQ